jgi:hypothetical protein
MASEHNFPPSRLLLQYIIFYDFLYFMSDMINMSIFSEETNSLVSHLSVEVK